MSESTVFGVYVIFLLIFRLTKYLPCIFDEFMVRIVCGCVCMIQKFVICFTKIFNQIECANVSMSAYFFVVMCRAMQGIQQMR